MKEIDKPIEEMPPPAGLTELIGLVEDDTINQSTAKDVLEEMIDSGKRASEIVEERGLAQISDATELEKIIDQILDENPEQVNEYLGGKKQVLGWFIGQVMKATRGKANPQLARKFLQEKLEGIRG
jgi:aspartyl-tRNA(Asn)/glutamyl-tRNA(Gln) amidotransferase subunit B